MNSNIWLIGTGPMAVDYAKVLKGIGKDFITIGRGEKNAVSFKEQTGVDVIIGGLEKFLLSNPVLPDYVINAVGIDMLSEVTKILLRFGCKNILLEKPGVAYISEIDDLTKFSNQYNANVLLAYNRRFYQSTIAAKKIIQEDGGVASFNFEFTEWSHQIESIKHLKTEAELQNWFLGNSTHVIDLAFYLGGLPTDMKCYYSGKGLIAWHTSSCNYSGAGITEQGALFSYHANWKAPGRFSVEILTAKHRLIFRPLEKLQIQNIGSVAVNFVEGIDYSLDEKYKPGLYLQTKAFLNGQYSDFININQQQKLINSFYKEMSGY